MTCVVKWGAGGGPLAVGGWAEGCLRGWGERRGHGAAGERGGGGAGRQEAVEDARGDARELEEALAELELEQRVEAARAAHQVGFNSCCSCPALLTVRRFF